MRSPDWLGEHDEDVLASPDMRSERGRIEAWRLQQLLDAGYPETIADRIAVNFSIDLHRAIEILKKGCAPELAAEILL